MNRKVAEKGQLVGDEFLSVAQLHVLLGGRHGRAPRWSTGKKATLPALPFKVNYAASNLDTCTGCQANS
jgi:hypothetical protein